MPNRVGVDLGGTKIEAIALDDQGRCLARQRTASPRGNYDATLTAISRIVSDFEREFGPVPAVGLGIPGAISQVTGLVKNANSTWLIGKPFDRDLEARLGKPVQIENDANCFALSEAVDGAAQGRDIVFGVILGTGVGGGLAIRQRVLTGANAIAGEWGHNPLPWPREGEWPGPDCYCGKTGCIETFLSGPGLAADHRRETGQDLDPAQIVAAAAAGDPGADATLARYEDRLARGLAQVINLLDPQVIVLGGGLSNIERLYRNVPALLPEYVFSDGVETELCPPQHGDSSGVRGAAWLCGGPVPMEADG